MFQENTTVFQANTNASLKNLETQVGQLSLAMQNQSRDSFPSDTKKNPKECMTVTLRSGKELQRREEAKKKKNEGEIEKANHNSMSSEKNQNRARLPDTNEHMKEQNEVAKEEKVQKEEVRVYQAPVSFPQRLQQSKLDNRYARFLNIFKKLEIKIPFAEALAQIPHYCKVYEGYYQEK